MQFELNTNEDTKVFRRSSILDIVPAQSKFGGPVRTVVIAIYSRGGAVSLLTDRMDWEDFSPPVFVSPDWRLGDRLPDLAN